MRAAVVAVLCAAGAVAHARPDDPGSTDLYHFAPGDVVESFDPAGGHFRVFFTRSGVNVVPLADADNNGTPDVVEEVGALYESVLTFYQGLGFRTPVSDVNNAGSHGGDGRFDVYLLNFSMSADGTFVRESCDAANVCSGYMVQENDFVGFGYPSRTYGNRVLASHELFHAVQAAYDNSETTVVSEGTAVWATERFDPTLSDFEGFVGGYLSRPDHSLYAPLPGPVDAFSYGAAIFFQFLDEKFGDAVIRELWEAAVGLPDWFSVLDSVLQKHQSSFAAAFLQFAEWNLFTAMRANPLAGYARGAGYPLVKMEADTAPLRIMALRAFPSATNYFALPPAGRTAMDAALVVPAGVDASPLHLEVAVRRGNVVAAPIAADARLRVSAVTDGADELVVVVVNTAESGESTRPGVCVGDPAEVDACQAQLAGGPDMGGAPPHGASGGCAVAERSAGVSLWPLVALTAWLLARRKQEAR